MQMQVLTPGVQHGEETDVGTEQSGLSRGFQQRGCGGAKQDGVNLFRVLQREPADRGGQCEYDMEIGNREKFASRCTSHRARLVGLVHLGRCWLRRRCQELVVVSADDRPSRADAASSIWNEIEIQRIERAGRGAHGYVGDLQVARRGFQVGVTEQDLNRAQIRSGFEQVRGKGMPQRVRMHWFGDAGGLRSAAAGQVCGFGRDGLVPVTFGNSHSEGRSARQ